MEQIHPALLTEQRNHTLLITLNNPPAHTWTLDSLNSFHQIITDAEQDRDIYSVVIIGDGKKFFSAGADLKQFANGDAEIASQVMHAFGQAFEALAAFRGVTIAAINGYALGGGLECALACDFRIADESAIMGLPEARVGLLPGGGGTQWLAHTVGEAWAKRIILLGEQVNAETALRIGLVEELVPTGETLHRALEMAQEVENQSPLSITKCKQLIQKSRHVPAWEALAEERDAFVSLFGSYDQKEGVSAFLEKRKPIWKNT